MFNQNASKRWSRAVMIAFGIGIVCTILASTSSAQVWDKKTTVTFSAPIEIPGVRPQVLPAGTYIFRLLDALNDRNVVQIFNADGSHLYATVLAIPNYRLKATNKTVMPFSERAAGAPQAIRAWFYPGDQFGQEFVYPKARALELAKETRQPIIYIPDTTAPEISAPVTSATEPPVVALEEAPLRAVEPTGREVEVTEVVEPPPVQTASLPKTAGNLPLLALIGLLSLGVAYSLRGLCVR